MPTYDYACTACGNQFERFESITAKPNTTYHFFLKCIRLLGDIKTWDEGEGQAEFSFSNGESGNVFAFDMYPEGAPPGNKYQSVQVKY